MKYALIVLFIALLLPKEGHSDPVVKTTGAFIAEYDRGFVGPALQIAVNAKPPLTCAPEARGTMSFDIKTHLCVCDGKAWTLVNSVQPCEWASTDK